MLPNIFLLDFKTDKNKNRDNIAINSCYFSKNNYFQKNLLERSNASNKIFFNNKNKKQFMLVSKKVKYISFEDLIEGIKLYFKNLITKNLASFYKIKNMIKFD